MIPAGQQSGRVLLSALAASAGVTLTATLGPVTLDATVRVLDGTEVPTVSLTPANATTIPGGTVHFTVTLSLPPAGDTQVALSLAPANAGMIPAMVTVLADQVSATFDYVDQNVAAQAMVTATLGANASTATIEISAVQAHLVINEVDYDQVGSDTGEYIELYNPGTSAVSLVGKAIVLVNGSNNTEYRRIVLDTANGGSLPAGGYLVIGAAAVTPMGAGIKYTPPVGTGVDQWPAQDAFQNGMPDGLALVDVTAMTIIDALAYEGAMSMVTITGFPANQTLTEGTFLPVATADSNTAIGSLSRLPNGTDMDNAATDWNFTTTITPGVANVP
jgi:large repetitive protein